MLYKYVRVLIKCLSAIVQMHCIGIGKDPAGFILKLNHKRHLLNKGMNEMFNKLNKNATIFKELSKTPSWWQTFKSNPDLYIEVRKDNQVNVYFEGGSVAKIHYCSRHKKLQVFTHHKYLGILKARTMYVECSDFIDRDIDNILGRVKSCYSQKKSLDSLLAKESWSEKYIQGRLITSNLQHHLYSEFAYKDKTTDIRIDIVDVVDGKITFVELKRLDDGRMLKESDDNPEIISQMNTYREFIRENKNSLLNYYQRLYEIKKSLGLPIPDSHPVDVNTTPELLIFNRWVKAHHARTQHRERMEQILKRENICYSIIDELL